MERTLVLIKPDAVRKKLVGEIIKMYEANGLIVDELYTCVPSKEILEKHYEEHQGRDFYKPLVDFMSSGKVVVILIAGENAVEVVREINGATNPAKARPCTIRYLYGDNVQQNAVHGSATLSDAEREVQIWFGGE